MKRVFFGLVFITVFFETADLRSYCDFSGNLPAVYFLVLFDVMLFDLFAIGDGSFKEAASIAFRCFDSMVCNSGVILLFFLI